MSPLRKQLLAKAVARFSLVPFSFVPTAARYVGDRLTVSVVVVETYAEDNWP
jgi:hypothetical protein